MTERRGIVIWGQSFAWDDPVILGLGALLALAGLWLIMRRKGASIGIDARLSALAETQQQLAGAVAQVAQLQSQSHVHVVGQVEARLADLGRYMGDTLSGSASQTAASLGALGARLEAIDRAQERLEALSGDVLSLQDILSNKQARGAFGEVQLHALVSDMLPAGSYKLQATLSNGRRADCLIAMPDPPGPLVIDAKFPLEAYEALRRATTDTEVETARRALRSALRVHIRAISERYIVPGETADGAVLFLPSEAVYSELHANLPEIVREGFAARVWIVSPTTMMATLNTLRAILKDTRMREQAQAVRRELQLLLDDLGRFGTRVERLEGHFTQAQTDLREIRVSADKIARRGARLDAFDFDQGSEPVAQDRPPSERTPVSIVRE